MTTPTSYVASTFPSRAERDAYIDALAPRRGIIGCGIVARLPLLGSTMLDWREGLPWTSWRDFFALRSKEPGSLIAFAGAFEVLVDMPDEGWRPSDTVRRLGHWPWCFLAVPVLLAMLTVKVLLRVALGDGGWRRRRPLLRLMWKLRPAMMAHRLAARNERELEKAAEYAESERRFVEHFAAKDAAKEAEIERRVAERLAQLAAAQMEAA